MFVDPAASIQAEIHAVYEDGIPYVARVWAADDPFAVILCHDCGELDETTGEIFSTWGTPDACTEDDRCNVCKCRGFLFITF